MHPETEARRKAITAKVGEAVDRLEAIGAKHGDKASATVFRLERDVSDVLDDIDSLFWTMLDEKRNPPRTLEQEAKILLNAEAYLEIVALPVLNAVDELIRRYGADLRAIGG